MAMRLQHLDGTPVLKQERLFLQRLHSRKLTRDASFKRTSDDSLANIPVSSGPQDCTLAAHPAPYHVQLALMQASPM